MCPDDRDRMVAHLSLHGWQATTHINNPHSMGVMNEDGGHWYFKREMLKVPSEGYRARPAGLKLVAGGRIVYEPVEWDKLPDEYLTLAYENSLHVAKV